MFPPDARRMDASHGYTSALDELRPSLFRGPGGVPPRPVSNLSGDYTQCVGAV